MYVCVPCRKKHDLKAGFPTTANGQCEICGSEEFLVWTRELKRPFPGSYIPSVEAQLKARRGDRSQST